MNKIYLVLFIILLTVTVSSGCINSSSKNNLINTKNNQSSTNNNQVINNTKIGNQTQNTKVETTYNGSYIYADYKIQSLDNSNLNIDNVTFYIINLKKDNGQNIDKIIILKVLGKNSSTEVKLVKYKVNEFITKIFGHPVKVKFKEKNYTNVIFPTKIDLSSLISSEKINVEDNKVIVPKDIIWSFVNGSDDVIKLLKSYVRIKPFYRTYVSEKNNNLVFDSKKEEISNAIEYVINIENTKKVVLTSVLLGVGKKEIILNDGYITGTIKSLDKGFPSIVKSIRIKPIKYYLNGKERSDYLLIELKTSSGTEIRVIKTDNLSVGHEIKVQVYLINGIDLIDVVPKSIIRININNTIRVPEEYILGKYQNDVIIDKKIFIDNIKVSSINTSDEEEIKKIMSNIQIVSQNEDFIQVDSNNNLILRGGFREYDGVVVVNYDFIDWVIPVEYNIILPSTNENISKQTNTVNLDNYVNISYETYGDFMIDKIYLSQPPREYKSVKTLDPSFLPYMSENNDTEFNDNGYILTLIIKYHGIENGTISYVTGNQKSNEMFMEMSVSNITKNDDLMSLLSISVPSIRKTNISIIEISKINGEQKIRKVANINITILNTYNDLPYVINVSKSNVNGKNITEITVNKNNRVEYVNDFINNNFDTKVYLYMNKTNKFKYLGSLTQEIEGNITVPLVFIFSNISLNKIVNLMTNNFTTPLNDSSISSHKFNNLLVIYNPTYEEDVILFMSLFYMGFMQMSNSNFTKLLTIEPTPVLSFLSLIPPLTDYKYLIIIGTNMDLSETKEYMIEITPKRDMNSVIKDLWDKEFTITRNPLLYINNDNNVSIVTEGLNKIFIDENTNTGIYEISSYTCRIIFNSNNDVNVSLFPYVLNPYLYLPPYFNIMVGLFPLL